MTKSYPHIRDEVFLNGGAINDVLKKCLVDYEIELV